MKKLISLVLTLILTAYGLTAFAATINQNTMPPAGTTPVSFDVPVTYTVTIPESITLTYQNTATQSFSVAASDLMLLPNQSLRVTAIGSGAGGAFSITNGKDQLAYQVSLQTGTWQAIAPGATVATFTANGQTPFYVAVPQGNWAAVTTAGAFTGNLVFQVSLVNLA